MTDSIRMPIAVASRKGLSAVVDSAEDQRVVLTRHGRPAAVVDSAERIDEDLRKVREAAASVLDAAADLVSKRSKRFSLDEACSRLGIDAGEVRARAGQRRESST